MGLDMYINRRRDGDGFGKKEWDKLFSLLPYEGYKHLNQWTELAYWRKANMIHKWFVDNVQHGKDDCGEYELTKKDCQKLLKACQSVLAVIRKGKFVPYTYGKPDENFNRKAIRVKASVLKPQKVSDFLVTKTEPPKDGNPGRSWIELDDDKLDELTIPADKKGKDIEYHDRLAETWLLDTKTVAGCKKILPCESGFFFGSTLYSQWYLMDILNTISQIEKVIKVFEDEEAFQKRWKENYGRKGKDKAPRTVITYSSSW